MREMDLREHAPDAAAAELFDGRYRGRNDAAVPFQSPVSISDFLVSLKSMAAFILLPYSTISFFDLASPFFPLLYKALQRV